VAESWKDFESRVAARFGGRRRGAQTSRNGEGLSDCVDTPGFAIEVKLRGRPGFQELLDACCQAEAAAADTEIPIAVVKRKRDHDVNALVVMRLPQFLDWLGPVDSEERG
jgi:hypothetical protein